MNRPQDPLEGVDRVLVDANNLLGALARSRDPRGAPLPPAALIGRLRAAFPPNVAVELAFDGAPDPGMRGARIASGVLVRYAGRRSADEVLVGLVDEARTATRDPAGADNILVVTDDRDLRLALGQRGARTARTAWLIGRLTRPSRHTAEATPAQPDRDDIEREPWHPGRGATAKRGNPRRRPRHAGRR